MTFCIHRVSTIRDITTDNTPIVLVGNKSDLTDNIAVTRKQVDKLSQDLGLQWYFETTVKDNVNVTEAVDKLIDLMYDNKQGMNEEKTEEVAEPLVVDVPKKDDSKEGILNQGMLVLLGVSCVLLFCVYYKKWAKFSKAKKWQVTWVIDK